MEGVQTGKVQYATLTTVDNQRIEGILNSIDDHSGKITLKNVSINKMRLGGLHYFYASNIKDLELTYGSQNTAQDVTKDKQKVRKSQQRRVSSKSGCGPLLLAGSPCHNLGDDSGDQGIGSSSEDGNFSDYYEVDNSIIFCRTCDKFRDSITYLMEQDVIAVSFYGVDISRKGVMSLIQVATDVDVIMYDVLRLGLEGFVDGLQAVLESDKVLKVIHDCRMVSDALFHQYDVTLSNVFDTQVGGVFAYRLTNEGDWPRFVDSLPITLISQLGLKDDGVHHFFSRDESKQGDEVWLQRPFCSQLLQNSLKNLMHMIPLYHTLREKLMMEFQIGVQLYIDHVRNTPHDRIDKCMSFSHLLPYIFQGQDFQKQVAKVVKETPRYRSMRSSLCSNAFTGKNNRVMVSSSEGETRHGNDPVSQRNVKSTKSCTSDKQVRPSIAKSKPSSTDTRATDHSHNTYGVSDLSLSDLHTAIPSPCKIMGHTTETIVDFSSLSTVPKNIESHTNDKQFRPSIAKSKPSSANTRTTNHTHGILELSDLNTATGTTLNAKPASNCSPQKRSSGPPAEVLHRLLPPPKAETEVCSTESDSSSVSEGYISSRSAVARSALMQIPPPSCSLTSSVCSSESCSEPDIEQCGQDPRYGYSSKAEWDADKGLQLELAQSILRTARRTHSSKSDIKKFLLPAKSKPS